MLVNIIAGSVALALIVLVESVVKVVKDYAKNKLKR